MKAAEYYLQGYKVACTTEDVARLQRAQVGLFFTSLAVSRKSLMRYPCHTVCEYLGNKDDMLPLLYTDKNRVKDTLVHPSLESFSL